MKELITISWTRYDGVTRSSTSLPMADMLQASTAMAHLTEMARQIQDIQRLEIENPNIIPGLVGHA